jgi:hypothetical protein
MQISSRAGADPLRIERRHLHHPRPAPLLHHPKPAPQLGVPVRDSAREAEARICTQHRLDDLFLSMSWSTTARGARLLTVCHAAWLHVHSLSRRVFLRDWRLQNDSKTKRFQKLSNMDSRSAAGCLVQYCREASEVDQHRCSEVRPWFRSVLVDNVVCAHGWQR